MADHGLNLEDKILQLAQALDELAQAAEETTAALSKVEPQLEPPPVDMPTITYEEETVPVEVINTKIDRTTEHPFDPLPIMRQVTRAVQQAFDSNLRLPK